MFEDQKVFARFVCGAHWFVLSGPHLIKKYKWAHHLSFYGGQCAANSHFSEIDSSWHNNKINSITAVAIA